MGCCSMPMSTLPWVRMILSFFKGFRNIKHILILDGLDNFIPSWLPWTSCRHQPWCLCWCQHSYTLPPSLQVIWHDTPVSAIYRFLLKTVVLLETRATDGQPSVATKPKLAEDYGILVESMLGTPLATAAFAASCWSLNLLKHWASKWPVRLQ
jgi:hypothetical protein